MNQFTGALILWFALTATGPNKSSKQHLRWVDFKTEPDITEKIKASLENEPYTNLREIGIYKNAALVLVSKREAYDLNYVPFYFDHLSAFNCNLDSSKCSEIWGGYKFELLGDGFFEKDQEVADLVFTYQRCVECEPSNFVSAFYYDSQASVWEVRGWGDSSTPGALIGYSDIERSAAGAYRVGDFDGDGVDDIGVWLRELGKGKVEDHFSILTTKNGDEKIISVHGKTAISKFKRMVCKSGTGEGDFAQFCAPFRER